MASCTGGNRSRRARWRTKPTVHAAPELGCRCGIYGGAVGRGRALVPRETALAHPRRLLIGRVALWGDVVEGPLGWRASHAYPIELFVPASVAAQTGYRRRGYVDETMLALEEYGVPVDLVVPGALTAR